MEPLIAPEEVSRRVRAAVEYANLSEVAAVEKTGLSPSNWRRIVSKSKPRGFKTIEEMWAVAAACDVPPDFLLHGFDITAWTEGEPASVTARLDDIANRLAATQKRLDPQVEDLATRVLELEAKGGRASAGKRGQGRNRRQQDG